MTTYTQTTSDRILQLRHQVLRTGLPIAEVIFAEDQDPNTRHYAGFDQQGELICCVTLIPSIWCGKVAWRLRAMATAPDWRGQGVGTGMIRHLLEDLQKSDLSRLIWCNARVKSAKFYRNLGWREVSEHFEHGNAGLSVRMLRLEKPLTTGQFRGAGFGSRIDLRRRESCPQNEQEDSASQIGNVTLAKPCFCSTSCF